MSDFKVAFRPALAGGAKPRAGSVAPGLKTTEPDPELDQVSLDSQPSAAEPEVRAPRWKRWLKWTGLCGAAVTAGLSAVGGIAYFGNRAALQEPVSVSLTVDLETQLALQGEAPEQTRASAPARVASPFAPVPAETVVAQRPQQQPVRGGVAVLIPVEQAQTWVDALKQQNELRQQLRQTISAQTHQIHQQFQRIELPSGDFLVDLKAPLPTGEQALLHLGNLDLPSLGYQALTPESLPLNVHLKTGPIAPGLSLKVSEVEAEPVRPASLKGPGIYLTALQVDIDASKEAVLVQGQAEVQLDLDGTATRARLGRLQQQLQKNPDDPALLRAQAALESRLNNAQQLSKRLSEGGADGLLEDAFQQQKVDYSVRVETGKGNLARLTYHVWLGPDVNHDGKADLHLAQVGGLDRLQELEVEVVSLQRRGELPEGWLGRVVNQQVAGHFHQGIRDGVAQAMGQLRGQAEQLTRQGLDRVVPLLQQQSNRELGKVYEQYAGIEIEGQNFSLDTLRVDGAFVTAGIDGKSEFDSELPQLPEGFLSQEHSAIAIASGVELNRQLAESVDWAQVLKQVNQANSGYRIELARDPQGKPISPTLTYSKGKPALQASIVAERIPVQRQEKGFSLGGLLQRTVSPDKLEAEVKLPFELTVKDGEFHLSPLTDAIELTRQKSAAALELVALLPDQALSKILASLTAGQTGPVALELGLGQHGVIPTAVAVVGSEHKAPSFAVGFQVKDSALHQAIEQLQR